MEVAAIHFPDPALESERPSPLGSVEGIVEPERGLGDCWPAFFAGSTALDAFVQIRRMVPCTISKDGFVAEWELSGAPDAIREIFGWISGKSEDCVVWARTARLFGADALTTTLTEGAQRDAEKRAVAAEESRLKEDCRLRQRMNIGLYILDEQGERPGLFLKSEDMKIGFWKMRLSERWERERILDWLRWQKNRFVEFREIVEAEGAIALERLIIAGMLEKERDMKTRKVASGGLRRDSQGASSATIKMRICGGVWRRRA